MIKNINELTRVNFTPYCWNCTYRRKYNDLEYCCSFVIDLLEQEKLNYLKKTILEYILGDTIEKLDKNNIFYSKEDKWSVTLTFSTNLREDNKMITNEIVKQLNNSLFFRNVCVNDDSLYKYSKDKQEHISNVLNNYLERYKGEC